MNVATQEQKDEGEGCDREHDVHNLDVLALRSRAKKEATFSPTFFSCSRIR